MKQIKILKHIKTLEYKFKEQTLVFNKLAINNKEKIITIHFI